MDVMVALTPSLIALSLAYTDVGTPASKRKAAVSHSGHWGLTNDSASAVALVVLSRLYHSRDETTLAAASRSPFGLAVLAALRALVLRVAIANGGADPALSESNLVTMFNLGRESHCPASNACTNQRKGQSPVRESEAGTRANGL